MHEVKFMNNNHNNDNNELEVVEKQQPTLSFFSFIYTVEHCSTPPKIPQNISQKLLDTAQISVYTGANYALI